jgi:ankyrin repeat protein
MPERIIPGRPNLEQYRKQAKELLRAAKAGEQQALARMHTNHPRLRELVIREGHVLKFALADAQLVIAREHGHPSWPVFAKQVESARIMRSVEAEDAVNTFIDLACVDRRGWHGGGSLEHAEMILAKFPGVASANIYSAAVQGDEEAVRDWLVRNRELATIRGGPHGWDALTYLCFSRYLRIDKGRSGSFAACARALLECGASANTGWMEEIDTPPRQILETAIYGAAGVAQSAAITQVLLDYGADPNDEETPYHVAETYDNHVLEVLLRSGRFNERSLATVAARKCDWHDDAGLLLALEHGANPNFMTVWKHTPCHQSIRRDNGLVMIELLLDHGADPLVANAVDGRNAFQMAAYCGRGDILQTFDMRGFTYVFKGMDALVAACARADREAAQAVLDASREIREQFQAIGGTLLARFSGPGNDAGVRTLLALGVSPNALWPAGDGYWNLAPGSTALHVAAWRANHQVVATLIAAGTDVNARDARNRTALQLAVKACTDSYWKYRRQPDSVAALLAAGATNDGIDLPTGYGAIDQLLLR